MADGKIEIETGINEKGLLTGLEKIKQHLKQVGDGSLTKGIANLGLAFSGVAGAAKTVTDAVSGTVKALDECAEAYRVQEKAELALQKAADNNPYLNGEGVARLKDYAGELQAISNYGDEGTIDVMAQLAATGRSEAEIMKIIGAAADYAAAKHIDLASAAQTLNATYSGMAGTVGRQIDDIKNLTDEQLKNGEAIDVIAEKYKGFAETAADTTTQLANAWGDFKENIGRGWDEITEPAKKALIGLLTDFNTAQAKINALKDANAAAATGAETAAQALLRLEAADAKLKEMYNTKGVIDLGKNLGKVANNDLYNKQLKEQLNIVAQLRSRYGELADAEEQAAEEAKKRAEEEAALAEQEEAAKKYTDYINESNKALEESVQAIKAKAEATGEEIDAVEMYNAYLTSYINLLAKSNGMVTADNEAAKERVRLMGEWRDKMKEAETEQQTLIDQQKKLADAASIVSSISGKTDDTFLQMKKKAADLYEQYVKITKTSESLIAKSQENNLFQFSKEELQDDITEQMGELGVTISNLFSDIGKTSGQRLSDDFIASVDAINDKYKDINLFRNALLQNSDMRNFLNIDLMSDVFEDRTKEQIEELSAAKKEFLSSIVAAAGADDDRGLSLFEKTTNAYEDRVKTINELKKQLEAAADGIHMTEEEIQAAQDALDDALTNANRDMWHSYMEDAQYYTEQITGIVNQFFDLLIEGARKEKEATLAELADKYDKGLIGEKEYENGVKEAKKKAADDEYAFRMVQWHMSMLTAAANIAEGVTKAIAEGGIAGVIIGSLVAASGALQIATIAASKPIKQSFATGGYVGGMVGASMGSDNTSITARTGELVVNAAQQRRMWELLNGAAAGSGGGMNVTVNNTQAGRVRTDVQQTNNGLFINILDKHINKGFKDGSYDAGFAGMQTRQQGVTLL